MIELRVISQVFCLQMESFVLAVIFCMAPIFWNSDFITGSNLLSSPGILVVAGL